jgi:hypothetical protein
MYLLSIANNDTSRVLALAELGNYYKFQKPDSGLFYAYKALALARQIKFPKGEIAAMLTIGITQIRLGNELKALHINRQATKIAEENNMCSSWFALNTGSERTGNHIINLVFIKQCQYFY